MTCRALRRNCFLKPWVARDIVTQCMPIVERSQFNFVFYDCLLPLLDGVIGQILQPLAY